MRNISFALTTNQIMEKSKRVTRRMGWKFAKVGQFLRPVKKCMGLKKGESLDILCDPIVLVDVRFEPLRRMTDEIEYGFEECRLEGFGDHPHYQWPSAFVDFFCNSHEKCTPDSIVTRLQFDYNDSFLLSSLPSAVVINRNPDCTATSNSGTESGG